MLYSEAFDLKAKDGMGAIRIAEILSRRYSLGISPRTIGRWIAGDRHPRVGNAFQDEPTAELSYVIGAVYGDGSLVPRSNVVKIEVTDKEFAERFNQTISHLFGRDIQNRILIRCFSSLHRLPLYVVKYASSQLMLLLRRPIGELDQFIRAYPREFLAGFFDAEGYVSVSARIKLSVVVGAENSDPALLSLVKSVLHDNLGIGCTLFMKRPEKSKKTIRGQTFETRHPVYSLLMSKNHDVANYLTNVGFSIPRKMEKLRDAVWLLEEFSPTKAASFWILLYEKRSNEWIKKGSA